MCTTTGYDQFKCNKFSQKPFSLFGFTALIHCTVTILHVNPKAYCWFMKTFWNDKEKIKESFDIVSQILKCERWHIHQQNNTSRGQAAVSVHWLTVSPPTDGFLLHFHVLMCQLAHRKLAWAPNSPLWQIHTKAPVRCARLDKIILWEDRNSSTEVPTLQGW